MHLFLEFTLRMLQDGGNSISSTWSVFSRPAAALALNAVWQGAAVALGLALCLHLAPRSPARHRFAMWAAGFGVLVALQVLPVIPLSIPVHLQTIYTSVAPIGVAASASHPWLQLSAAWSLVIAALWLAASLYRAADLALHSLHLRKLWMTAVPVDIDPASLPRTGARLSRSTIQICTTSELERPSVIGFFAPRILIPRWLFLRLTPGELDQIVLHETEHLRRRDDWTNLLQKLCLVLFPLNPGMAWIERRMCGEREMACDDGVIRVTRAPRAYAACLASLAERGLERRAGMLSLGVWHARPELVRRVHSILRRKHALSPFAARAVLGAVGCVLVAGATALARCPRLVAFAPARGSAAAHTSFHEPLTALNGREYAFNAHASSGRVFTDLKGHGMGRADADNAPTASTASAPERIAPRSVTHATNLHRAAGPRPAPSEHNAASPKPATLAIENPSLRPGSAAGPAFSSDSAFTVMSAWESVEVTAPQTCPTQTRTKSAECSDSIRAAGPEDARTAQRIPPRISVTRMYLKIYSIGDKGSTWLVIQL